MRRRGAGGAGAVSVMRRILSSSRYTAAAMAQKPPFFASSVRRVGLRRFVWSDLYHHMMSSSWLVLLGSIAILYLLANMLFACAYLAGGACIENARPGHFWDHFFFSVQTMATIGYGSMWP